MSLSPRSVYPQRPRIALTLGDPAGIGAEIILKALAHSDRWQDCELTVIGTRSHIEKTYHQLCALPTLDPCDLAHPDQLNILDIPLASGSETFFQPGMESAVTGAASFAYLDKALRLTLAGTFQAIVTAPIAKSAWKAAGHLYPGQTEVLAERAGVDNFGMFFVARSPHSQWILRTLLATTHIPLCQVSPSLTPALLSQKLDLLIATLRTDFGLASPTIAIAGLNPHSGEKGQLGTEEIDWMIPWLAAQRQRYPQAKLMGLVPPDTLWVKPGQAWWDQGTPADLADAYLALYHDQGLIPVKLMAFEQAINTTIGLPFIRTSPDHGTAFDIAGQGIANASSLEAAIQLAVELAQNRLDSSVPNPVPNIIPSALSPAREGISAKPVPAPHF